MNVCKSFVAVGVLALAANAYGQSFSTKEGTLANYTGKNASNSFEVGDKIFSNFVYSPTGDMPKAKDVNILGGTDSLGNFGFRLTGAFGSLSGKNADAILSYTVTVDNSGNLVPLAISDAHLAGNPNVTSGNGSMSVTETFTDPVFNTDLSSNTLSIFNNVPGTSQNSADTIFGSLFNTLNVQKDIEALSQANNDIGKGLYSWGDGKWTTKYKGGIPTLSYIDQTFSETPVNLQLPPPESTPEPASLALVLIGGAACLVYRRCR